jgi:hypothetical protein
LDSINSKISFRPPLLTLGITCMYFNISFVFSLEIRTDSNMRNGVEKFKIL